jgi:hypothetical protein
MLIFPRWIALITVMAGVTLVGFSGSLVKETLQEDPETGFVAGTLSALGSRAAAVLTASEADEKPEATNVVLGKLPTSRFSPFNSIDGLLALFNTRFFFF